MFFVTLLNQIYWVTGATLGALLGYVIQFDTTGIEFVMTALFVVMFINQWEETSEHTSALIGLGASLICLLLFGSDKFILPAMALIILCFTLIKGKRRQNNDNGSATHNYCSGHSWNHDNKIFSFHHLSGR